MKNRRLRRRVSLSLALSEFPVYISFEDTCMLGRAIVFFMKGYRCGRGVAVFLLVGLAVDIALAIAAVFLFGRLFVLW